MTEKNWVAILIYQSEAILALNGEYITSAYEDNQGEMDVLEVAVNSLARMFNVKLQTIKTDEIIGEVEDGECGAVIRRAAEVLDMHY
jgi:hypothetical protein